MSTKVTTIQTNPQLMLNFGKHVKSTIGHTIIQVIVRTDHSKSEKLALLDATQFSSDS